MSGGGEPLGGYDRVSGSVPAAAGPDVMLQFQDSTYVAGAQAGRMQSTPQQPQGADDSFGATQHAPGGGGEAGGGAPSRWGFLSIGFYRPYFDVDTVDVLERIQESLMPYPRSAFLEKTSLNPDMYGPFWICTTLVFLTAALGNLSAYLSHRASISGRSAWHYDINLVSWATGIVYGYTLAVPLVLYFALRYINISSGLVQLWCLYGYSLFVFIPTSFLTVIPVEFLRWVAVLGATALSATFLGTNLRAQLVANHDSWLLVVGGAVCLQVVLGVLLKLYFFTHFGGSGTSIAPTTSV